MKSLKELIQEQDLEAGFSIALKWEIKRYVVANTHNELKDWELSEDFLKRLAKQVNDNTYVWTNVTIGGWKDKKTWKVFIDAGMSTDDLGYAINVGKYTKQIAIYDTVEEKEIILQY